MYTFGLGRPVYSFGLGLPYATQSIEIDVDFATLQLLGHALSLDLTVDQSVERFPSSASLIFIAYPASVAARYDLPDDYFLDPIRIESSLDTITITQTIDLIMVQKELDSIYIQELEEVLIQERLDLINILQDSN